MKKLLVCAIALLFSWATFAADDLDEATAAYKRKDFATALRLVKPLADQGVPRAQHGYGLQLFFGQGVAKDQKKGLELITSAAVAGYAKAQAFLAAKQYLDGPTPNGNDAAFAWAQKSAAQAEPMGHAMLGYAYLYGLGAEQNFELAREEFARSAVVDNPFGQLQLGKMYLIGLGGQVDFAKAEPLLKSAAASPESAERASLILRQSQALLAWRKGLTKLTCDGMLCAAAWSTNRRHLSFLYSNREWIELAAYVTRLGKKDDLAYFYLGRSSEGIGDFDAAITYYKLALTAKDAVSLCDGVGDNCDGLVFPRDINARTAAVEKMRSDAAAAVVERKARAEKEAADARALALRQQEEQRIAEAQHQFDVTSEAARTGSALAQYQLAQLYFSGLGVEASDEQGIHWLTESAVGLPQAQFELGERFYRGKGVPIDFEKAEALMKSALQRGYADTNGNYAALQAELKERRGEMVYASTPFNTKATVLPKGLKGADVRALLSQFLRTPYPIKTDFETVDDHKKRVLAWEEKLRPIVGMNRLQAFTRNGFATNNTDDIPVLKFEGYDIDSQVMRLNRPFNWTGVGAYDLLYDDERKFEGAYQASNAFGAKLGVERWNYTRYAVKFAESVHEPDYAVTVRKDIAARISKNLTFVLIGRLVAPYAEHHETRSDPTFKRPYEISERNYSLLVDPVAFWLVDPVTGEVLFKTDAKKKK